MQVMKLIDVVETCCPVLSTPVIDQDEAERMADAFRVLADPARLRLLSMIAAEPDCEACVCELTEPLSLSQPTVSHHLKVLHDAGFLSREKRGTWVYYRVVPHALEAMRRILAPIERVDRYAPKPE